MNENNHTSAYYAGQRQWAPTPPMNQQTAPRFQPPRTQMHPPSHPQGINYNIQSRSYHAVNQNANHPTQPARIPHHYGAIPGNYHPNTAVPIPLQQSYTPPLHPYGPYPPMNMSNSFNTLNPSNTMYSTRPNTNENASISENKWNDDSDLHDGFPKDFDPKKHRLQGYNGSTKQDGSMDDYVIKGLRTVDPKTKPMFQCIGQILMDVGQGKDNMRSGTGTVIKKLPNHCFVVLTCAHNMVQYDKITNKKQELNKVWFLPAGCANQACRLQLMDKSVYNKYKPENDLCAHDLAVVLFHDKKGSKGRGSQYYDGVHVDKVAQVIEWKGTGDDDADVSLFGYPSKSGGLLQGQAGEAELKRDRGLWMYQDIYTYPGQSGSAIFRKLRRNEYGIYGIHTFGDTAKIKTNCGIFLDKEKREWIQTKAREFELIAIASAPKESKALLWFKSTGSALLEIQINKLLAEGFDNMIAISCIKNVDLEHIGLKRGHRKQLMGYVQQMKTVQYNHQIHQSHVLKNAESWLQDVVGLDEKDTGTLLDEGYDNMDAIVKLDEDDLKEMCFKNGRIRQIMHIVKQLQQLQPDKVYERLSDDERPPQFDANAVLAQTQFDANAVLAQQRFAADNYNRNNTQFGWNNMRNPQYFGGNNPQYFGWNNAQYVGTQPPPQWTPQFNNAMNRQNLHQQTQHNTNIDPVSKLKLEAAKWKTATDPSTEMEYWYHTDTKETVWDTPDAVKRLLGENVMSGISNTDDIDKPVWDNDSEDTDDEEEEDEDDEEEQDQSKQHQQPQQIAQQYQRPNTMRNQESARQMYLKPMRDKGQHELQDEKQAEDNPWISAEEAKTRVIVRDTLKKYWNIGAEQSFKLDGWANMHYHPASHKKGLFGKKQQTIADVLSYVEFTKLKTPLNRAATSDQKLKEHCMQTWKSINSYMGNRKSGKSSEGHVEKLVRFALKGDDKLRTEIYCQLAKQTTKNPKLTSLLKGWKLLLICCYFFPPSDQFVDYLACFIWNNTQQPNEIGQYAIKALHALDATMLAGSRKFPPLPLETVKIENLQPIPLNIYFINGMRCKQVLVTSQTRAKQVIETLVNTFNFKHPEAFGLYEMEPNIPPLDKMKKHYIKRELMSEQEKIDDLIRMPLERELEEDDRMLDVIASWLKRDHDQSKRRKDTESKNKSSKNARFVFKVKTFRKPIEQEFSPMGANANFLTPVWHVVNDFYPFGSEDEDFALDLAALQLQGTWGPNPKLPSTATQNRSSTLEIENNQANAQKAFYKEGLLTYDLHKYLGQNILKKYLPGKRNECEQKILQCRANKYSNMKRRECCLLYAKKLRSNKKMYKYFGCAWYRGVRIPGDNGNDKKMIHPTKSSLVNKDRNTNDLLVGINEHAITFVNPITQHVVERYEMEELLTFGYRSNAFLFVAGTLMTQSKIQIATMHGKAMNRLVRKHIDLRVRDAEKKGQKIKNVPKSNDI